MDPAVAITFVLVLSVVFGGYWFFVLRPETADQQALRRRMKSKVPGGPGGAGSAGSVVRQDRAGSAVPWLDRLVESSGRISQPIAGVIDRAGMKMTVGTLLAVSVLSGVLGYVVVWFGTRFWFLALFVGIFAGCVPFFVVNFKAKQRVRLFEEQFPEAIDLLARALRAGHAFITGLSMVADEMPDPVGTEFRLAFDRQNFGMPLPEALRLLGERVPLLDARFFVTAVLTQREAGGNLSEVLDNLATVIRERFRGKRQVRVTTAHARMTGWVLAVLPVALGVVLTLLSPAHMSLLWTDPIGIKMLTTAIVLQVVGSLIIRRLVDVEY
jgi:tight adherence protein B